MPQLSIPNAPVAGYKGQIAEPMPMGIRSFTTQGATMQAGQIVIRGTNPGEQVAPIPTSAFVPSHGNIAGVICLSTSDSFEPLGALPDGRRVSVMRLGSIYLNFSAAVTAGQQVGYVMATGALVGIAQGAAAGAIPIGTVVIPGLRVALPSAGAGVAIVEVNLFGAQDNATVGTL